MRMDHPRPRLAEYGPHPWLEVASLLAKKFASNHVAERLWVQKDPMWNFVLCTLEGDLDFEKGVTRMGSLLFLIILFAFLCFRLAFRVLFLSVLKFLFSFCFLSSSSVFL